MCIIFNRSLQHVSFNIPSVRSTQGWEKKQNYDPEIHRGISHTVYMI